jgi:predicted RNA-binding protein YlxR (DUF448 family)
MSLLNYFQPVNGLPDPKGELSESISPEAIALANREVKKALSEKTKRRGSYICYSEELRAEIGHYACIHGTSAAARYFSRKFKEQISKSTVQSIKQRYQEERKSISENMADQH